MHSLEEKKFPENRDHFHYPPIKKKQKEIISIRLRKIEYQSDHIIIIIIIKYNLQRQSAHKKQKQSH